MGVSTFKNFATGQNYTDFADIGKFSLEYQIEGGADDGFVFPIDMVPCTDEDWNNFYEPYSSHAASIAAHRAANQFFCPEAFDLSVINTFDNPTSKIVLLKLTACSRAEQITCVGESDRQRWFNGKQLMLLQNSERIDFNQESIRKAVRSSNRKTRSH